MVEQKPIDQINSYKDVYGGGFLKGADLPENKDVPVTIKEVRLLEFNDAEKFVLSFHEMNKDLTLNNTNILALEKATQTEKPKEWQGKSITLYRVLGSTPKGEAPVVRIRQEPPRGP